MNSVELEQEILDRPPRAAGQEFWTNWLLALELFGYPVAALLSTVSFGRHELITYSFRGIVACLAVFLILRSLNDRLWVRSNLVLALLTLLYCGRLLWDWLIVDYQAIPGPSNALILFTGVVVIPALALGYCRTIENDETKLVRLLAIIGASLCGTILMFQSFGWAADKADTLVQTGGRYQLEAMNAITIGHIATSTLVCLLTMTLQKPGFAEKGFLSVGALLAVACLASSGSRGPLLALVACLGVYAFLTRKYFWVFLAGILLLTQLFNDESIVLKRLNTVGKDASATARLEMQGNAMEQFLESPILGSAYVENISRDYPHNLFVEMLMALGVVGTALLLIVLRKVYRVGKIEVRNGRLLFPLLFLQFFVGIQFSGSLWASSHFGVMIAIMCSPIIDLRNSWHGSDQDESDDASETVEA